jgi:PPM family protein phosphatase
MQIESGASTSAGQKRSRNEDTQVCDGHLGLYLVVDGMGGHARGDIASKVVAETITHFVADTANDRGQTWPFAFDPRLSYQSNRFKAAIYAANRALANRIHEDDQLRGMGATLAGALLDDDHAVLANVGDCRVYLLRSGTIRQITSDHSWIAEQVRSGLIDERDAKHHPMRNLVTRAVAGAEEQVKADTQELLLQHGDSLIVCSDGLHGLFSDDELLQYSGAQTGSAQAVCDALVAQANERGAPDNVTVVVVRVST